MKGRLLIGFCLSLGFLACGTGNGTKEIITGFVLVKAGQFTMGSPLSEISRYEDESQHLVKLSRDFLMAKYDVTVREFHEFVLSSGYVTQAEKGKGGTVLVNGSQVDKTDADWKNPYFRQSDSDPVVLVTWRDAVTYCNWRSTKEGLHPAYSFQGPDVQWNQGANGYRLPTEAEWEFAARGGADGSKNYKTFPGSDKVDEVAWYSNNSEGRTHPVGQKKPNELGLYDMCGNAAQYCWDWLDAYPTVPQTDPIGGARGPFHVARGGWWHLSAGRSRTALRGYHFEEKDCNSALGFRLVRFQ